MSEKKPHICFVALNAFPILSGDSSVEFAGGAELQQVELARKLVKAGYKVTMTCRDDGQKDGCEIASIRVLNTYERYAGIPVLRFFHPRLTGLWRAMRRADADIYYVRTASMQLGVVAAFCKRHGKKSIFAGAGNPDFDRNTSNFKLRRDRWIYEYGLRNVDQIVAQNETQVALCKRNHGRDAILIPSMLPSAGCSRVKRRSHILWVSTIRQIKRPHLLIELARLLPEVKFRMIGGNDPCESDLYDDIEAQAAMQPNVEFLGFVPYAKVHGHFDRALIFVNTSSSEGFPNTFLQSWLRTIPTVSFVDSGARMNGRRIGEVVGTLPEMASRISSLLENSTERVRLGEESKRYVMREHGADRIIGLYEGIFGQLLETAGKG